MELKIICYPIIVTIDDINSTSNGNVRWIQKVFVNDCIYYKFCIVIN